MLQTGLTALLIDDNEIFRKSLKLFLEKHHCEVLCETDSLEEAKASIKNQEPSIIILDLVMPEQDSLKFLSGMKQGQYNIPIVVCSSLTEEHVISKALEAGCFDYLTKPLEEEKLLAILEKLKPTTY